MQLGWALLGGSTQISPPGPEVVGAWGGRETRGRKWWGGQEGGKDERSDEAVKLREGCKLSVQSCDEMW